MKLSIKKICMFSIIMYAGLLNAIASEIVVAHSGKQDIIFIKDRHIDQKTHKKSGIQKERILNHCCLIDQTAANKNDTVLLITEDQHFYNGANENVKKFIDKASAYLEEQTKNETRATDMQTLDNEEIVPGSILANFTNDSLNMNLDCYNAECRQAGYASQCDDSITGADVVIAYDKNYQEIMNDLMQLKVEAESNPNAQILYEQCILIMQNGQERAHDLVEKLRNSSLSMRQLEAQGQIVNEDHFLDLFDRYFIDVRILLSCYKNKNRETVIVVAGFKHIERILPVFEQLGYGFMTYGRRYDDRIEMVKNCIDIDGFFQAYNNDHFNSYDMVKRVNRVLVSADASTFGAALNLMTDGIARLFV